MTTGTKIFRIIISILLALTMLWSALLGIIVIAGIRELVLTDEYKISVAGVPVTNLNKHDILGDGTVYYDVHNNVLTLDNAEIESVYPAVYSAVDLNIELVGENRLVCNNEGYSIGVYAGDSNLGKELAFIGDGSLTVELSKKSEQAAGIFASHLTIYTDISVTTSDCENMANGLVCENSLLIVDNARVTVNNGAAKYSSGVRVRGDAFLEGGTALNVFVNSGSNEACKGFSINGDLYLGKDSSLEVHIGDENAESSECIRVTGLMEIEKGAVVTASAKNTHAVACYGTVKANKGAVVCAESESTAADIFCSGAVINYGAEINAEIDAVAGIRNNAEG